MLPACVKKDLFAFWITFIQWLIRQLKEYIAPGPEALRKQK